MSSATDAVAALTALTVAVGELRRMAGLEVSPDAPGYLHTAIELADATLDAVLDAGADASPAPHEIAKCLRARSRAVEQLQLVEERRIAAVSRSVQRLRGTVTVDALIGELRVVCTTDLGFQSAHVYSFEDGMVVSPGGNQSTATEPGPLSDTQQACLRSGQPVVVDATGSASAPNSAQRTTSAVIAPLTVGDARIAILHASVAAPLMATRADAEAVGVVATMAGLVMERILRAERLRANDQAMLAAAQRLTIQLSGSNAEIDFDQDAMIITAPESEHSLQPTVTEQLTPRETEVLALIIEGASNTQIAEQLVISIETVKTHVKKVLRKLGAVNRAEAISLAILDGSQSTPEPFGHLPGRKDLTSRPA